MFKLWKITILGIVVVIFFLLWIFVVGISAGQSGGVFNKGHNAVWIGHEWVGKEKANSDVYELVNTLKSHGVDTVFVHVGPLNSDGSIYPATYQHAMTFLAKARSFDDSIKYQAWMGQIRSKIDLSDEGVRKNTSRLCMIMSEMVGFDGIHFDIEPVWDEDLDFIELLSGCRDVLGDGKKISVALAEFIPNNLIWFMEGVFDFENYNTEVNYENVAKYADQIVVMVYDTGINRDWLYRWLVKEETIRVTDLLEGKEVFIAIPAYDDEKEGFNPLVENVSNGVSGVVSGMNNFRSNEENFAGIAIYPYWEIDEEEWGVYDEFWLK